MHLSKNIKLSVLFTNTGVTQWLDKIESHMVQKSIQLSITCLSSNTMDLFYATERPIKDFWLQFWVL